MAAGWLSVGIGMSVHTLATFPLATYGSRSSSRAGCRTCSDGRLLGAYCLSEPDSGSDAAALSTRAVLDGDAYVVTGTKAWITHGGVADFYNLMVRTSDAGPRGISCLLAEASTPGLSAAEPERKMGRRCLTHGADPAGRCARGRGAADRRGGPGLLHRAGRARLGTARHRGLQRRPRPGRARRGRRLRGGAAAVRSADRRLPGTPVHACRHGDAGRGGPRALPVRRPTRGQRARRSGTRPRWRSCSPRTPRCG